MVNTPIDWLIVKFTHAVHNTEKQKPTSTFNWLNPSDFFKNGRHFSNFGFPINTTFNFTSGNSVQT